MPIHYVLALVAAGIAVLLRWLLDPWLGNTLPLVTLFGAVAAVVWFAGYRPALVTTLVGYVASWLLFIEPRGQFSLKWPGDIVGLGAYLFTAGLIIVVGEAARRAQHRAREDHERLQVTLRSIGDAVITTDTAGRITNLNGVAEQLTGWTLDDATGKPLDQVFQILNETTRERVPNPAMRALREGVVVGLANHTVLVRRDGSDCPIDDSAAPIRDEQGRVSGSVLIFRDVTAQRRAQQDRARQLEIARLLAAIVESSDDGIVSKSIDGTIRSWNAGAERIFGYTEAEAVGRHISLVIPPDRIGEEAEFIVRLAAGHRIEQFETIRMRKDGGRIRVSLTISPLRDAAGRVVGASKIVRDISARAHAEAERRQLATLVENSADFIGICDLQGVPFFVNRAGLALVGLDTLESARQVNASDFFFPEDRPFVMEEFFPRVAREGHGEIDIRFRHFKTGEARWMAYKVLALPDETGQTAAFATVSQDVTERRQLNDHLREMASNLALADQRKNEFLATLAHELRNPLAPLINMLEVLKRSDLDDETFTRAHETMARQLGQLVRLVDDLLDVNRITYNRLELRRETVEIAPVIQHAIAACRPLAERYRHTLDVDVPAAPIFVDADPARLAQIFDNLLNNACKYTPPGGRISVTVRADAGRVAVSVKDTGVGIPGDKRDRIFDMFTQIEPETARTREGLGIGLTLVKRLVEMHDGTVEVRSAGTGQGSEFLVSFPTLPSAQDHPPAEARHSSSEARRILVVDDNHDAATSLAMLLEIHGHATFTAHDGEAALAAAAEHRPDVVLLDIGLPKVDGHEVCRRLRAEPWGRDIAIIALTGWGQDDDRRRSELAGFNSHLVKPIDLQMLSALLHDTAARERSRAS